MGDELVLAREAVADDAARAILNVAVIRRGILVGVLDVTSQVSFASVVVHTEFVRAKMTL